MAVIPKLREAQKQTYRLNGIRREVVAALAVAFPLVMCLLGMLLNIWWSGR
jgi:hypothetical protein